MHTHLHCVPNDPLSTPQAWKEYTPSLTQVSLRQVCPCAFLHFHSLSVSGELKEWLVISHNMCVVALGYLLRGRVGVGEGFHTYSSLGYHTHTYTLSVQNITM